MRTIVQTDLKAIEFCCKSLTETSENWTSINNDSRVKFITIRSIVESSRR
jgi:hypothetical protein